MKKCLQIILYLVAIFGIIANLFFSSAILGVVGYASLCIASILQIVKIVRKK